ncbi:arylamine N-acetyltransferase family protein [Streptomyces silvisoli]|uniref:Arylamine N-acetyltransferase n=1 Tax=Streptomyces silvisoli TaxID=3034235 RepID=A0ABT5ZS48_9ACTN|nr:arylamine N-acetyltransferase [Streptomyces silvisoli]MDF3292556.1 arylamine N-acetyltransferase [Streptomyces silvisoli]
MTESLWSGAELDLDAYLRRIGYDGSLRPTFDTLRALHRGHLAAIPFENLEIVLGRSVPLDVPTIQAKLVGQSRGGYCFEHNLLFAAVLERLGYSVTGLASRVRMGSDQRRATTHMLLRVDIAGEDWLADVGFGGDGPLEPIPLRTGVELRHGGWTFDLLEEAPGVFLLRSHRPDGWFDLHAFTLEPRYPVDYGLFNYYTSTHPQSPFTPRVIVQRNGPDVRRTLVGQELRTERPEGTVQRRDVPADELPTVLAKVFGIELDAQDARSIRDRHR